MFCFSWIMDQKLCRRSWRKLVKKLQRKRKRQKLARQRDKELKEAELEKLKDPLYKSWIEQQESVEYHQQLVEKKEHQEQEEMWLRTELLAQKQFKIYESKRKAEEAKLETDRLKREEELKMLEENRQKKHQLIQLQAEKAAKDFDHLMTSMQEYLENVGLKTPARLNCIVESRPGEKSCNFFDKTNCCRFGSGCTFNHTRPMLGKIILIKHFFQHPLLELQEHDEYSRSDSELELNERDLRDDYDNFCEDVWPVLEEFGAIANFRTVRNVHGHLRGNVFVEYTEKRSALKAFINLQNRFYASKRLNVEFSNIRHWRAAVCGLSLGRKCPKGNKCNFLHFMKNLNNKYNQPLDSPDRLSRNVIQSFKTSLQAPVISWNTEDNVKAKYSKSRNWRWSESPELELKSKKSNEHFKTINDNEYHKSLNLSHLSYCTNIKSAGQNSGDKKSATLTIKSTYSSGHKNKKSRRKEHSRSSSKPENKNKESSKTSLRLLKYSHRQSNSPDFHKYKKSKSQHRINKTFPSLERQKCTKSNSKTEAKSRRSSKSKSKRKKYSHKESNSPELLFQRKIKRSRSKSPSSEKKKKSKSSRVKGKK